MDVRDLRRRRRGMVTVGFVALAMAALWSSCGREADRSLRVGSFNIELFPHPKTDEKRVAALIAELDADVIAVQEISDADAFAGVLRRASRGSPRDYRPIVSPCVGAAPWLVTGLAYDAARLEPVAVRHVASLDGAPDGGGAERCSLRDRPAVFAVFETPGGQRRGVLSVHLRPYPRGEGHRRRQIAQVLSLVERLEKEFQVPVLVAGDFNTTSRMEIRKTALRIGAAGRHMPSVDLSCSEYWLPEGERRYQPSLLDHFIVGDAGWRAPQVMGMCAELSCQTVPRNAMHDDFRVASDHCPIRIERPLP